MRRKLEVHRHAYVSGPNANWSPCREVVHSHEGGDEPHEHEHTGPACYAIDKDDWHRRTGLRGGGRKKFAAKPMGLQMRAVALHPDRLSYDIIVVGPPATGDARGPGLAVPARLDLAFGARPRRVVGVR